MESFTFSTAQHIICGAGESKNLGKLCAEQGYAHAFLITDEGLAALGLHQSTLEALRSAGLQVSVYSSVQADPAEQIVLDAVAQAQQAGADVVIGFGGGSSMDVAKLVAFLAYPHCAQSLADIYGVGNARGQRLPLIQVPTTAGTGSEVTQVSIVTTGATTKMGAVSPLFLPDYAILDAELTLGLPPAVTAATGVDAMVHAIEAYTSKLKKNPMSDMLARQALQLLAGSIRTAVNDGRNVKAREKMLLGAMLAGQAFANAPVAAVHALAYPLGGHFHIPHGLSNALVLPHVMRFNASACADLYSELAPLIFPEQLWSGSPQANADKLIDGLAQLNADLGLQTTLAEMNIAEDFLPTLAEDAMLQQRLLINNPRPIELDDALSIYRAAF